jgi:hypothetical protein
MRKLLIVFALFITLSVVAFAQQQPVVAGSVTLSNPCTSGSPFYANLGNGIMASCQFNGTIWVWTLVGGGGGGGNPGGSNGQIQFNNAGVFGGYTFVPIANGGTGTGSPSLVAGTNVSITGTWPNQTINAIGGGGTGVSSVAWPTFPAWLVAAVTNPTTSVSLALTAATGQTSHQVIGTCGSATSFAPCSLVAADLPLIPLITGVTGILPIVNGGTGTASPGLIAGTNVTITGSWPNQTINSSGGGGGGGTGNAAAEHTVTFSATPTYTCSSASAGTVEDFTLSTALTANVTSATLSTCTSGETLNFTYTQDGTGSRTVVMPSGFDACPISPTASAATTCGYWYDGTNGHLIGSESNDVPSVLLLSSTRVAPTTVPPGGAIWPDSTDNDTEYRQTGGGSIFAMFLKGGDANPVTGVVSKINTVAFPTSATVVGSNGSAQPIAAGLQGNGTLVQLSTGLTVSGDCGKYDASGNIVDSGNPCGTGTGNAAVSHTVTFSTTPSYTCSSSTAGTVDDFILSTALSANVTSSTISTCKAGEALHFTYTQASSGGPYTVVMPTNFDACPVSPTASSATTCGYWYDGTSGHLVGVTSNDTPSILLLSATRAAPTVVPSGGASWPDSTDNDLEYRQTGGGSIFKMFLTASDCNPVTGVCTKTNGTAFGPGATATPSAGGQLLDSISAGAASYSATPTLGTDNSVAGTLQMSNGAAAAHTIWGSAATTSNSINGFTTAPTTLDLIECTTASTTCTLTDTGILTSNVVNKATTNVGTTAMTINMSASTAVNAFRTPNQSSPTPTNAGAIDFDTTGLNYVGVDGTTVMTFMATRPGPGVTTGSTCGSPSLGTGSNDHFGTITAGAVTTCTLSLTFSFTAPHGWSCMFNDQTTAADTVHQHSNTATTSVTNAATIVSGDVINYVCGPF